MSSSRVKAPQLPYGDALPAVPPATDPHRRWAPTRTDRSGIRSRQGLYDDAYLTLGDNSGYGWQPAAATDVWGDQSGTPVPPPLPRRRRAALRLPRFLSTKRQIAALVAAVLLLLCLGSGTWMLLRYQRQQRLRQAAERALALGSDMAFRHALSLHRQSRLQGATRARFFLLAAVHDFEHGAETSTLAHLPRLSDDEGNLEAARLASFYRALEAGDAEMAATVLPPTDRASLAAEVWRAHAWLRSASGDLPAALQAARRAYRAAPKAPRHAVLVARLLLQQGDWRAAVALLHKLGAQENVAVRLVQAQALMSRGDAAAIGEARRLLQRGLAAESPQASARQQLAMVVHLASLEANQGSTGPARKWAANAFAQRALADDEMRYRLAAVWIELGSLPQAKALLPAPAAEGKLLPWQALVHAQLAIAERHWSAAADWLTQAGDTPTADLQRGIVYQAQGQGKQAEAHYRRALAPDGEQPDAWRGLLQLALDAGDAKQAHRWLDKVSAATQPNGATGMADAELKTAKARLLLLDAAGQAAVAALQPLAQASRDAELWSALGQACWQAELHADAKQAFEHALALQAKHSGALLGLALLAIRQGQLREAAQRIDQAEKLTSPSDAGTQARVLAARAALHFEYGDLTAAEKAARRAATLDAATSEAHAVLAAVDEEKRRDPIPSLRHAIAGTLPSSEALAKLSLKLGSSAEGCQLGRRYLEAVPQGYDVAEVRRLTARCR